MKKLILLLGLLTPLFLAAQVKSDSILDLEVDTVTTEQIFVIVEQMPMFEGGQDSLMSFLQQNIQYPVKAKAEKKEGRVYVGFIVNKVTEVTEVKILKGVSPEIDAEAIRVVKLMPKWKTPGKQGGKPVNVQMTLPIKFVLPKN